MSIWHVFELFIFPYSYYLIFYLISSVLEFIASLLLMIGFILYQGEQSKRAQISYGAVSPTGLQIQRVPARFCPKCGKQIPTDAQFCPFCGWQAEGKKKVE
jgi:hypothetical protein